MNLREFYKKQSLEVNNVFSIVNEIRNKFSDGQTKLYLWIYIIYSYLSR